jgi:predicted CopG family antitoxin
MSEEKATVEAQKFEAEVTLSEGGVLKITKLKAGKYFVAQKLFSDWISQLTTSISGASGVSKTKGDGSLKTKEEVYEELVQGKFDVSSFVSKISGLEDNRIKFLAAATGLSEEELMNNYYPEDLNKITDAVIELNNFLVNLKNSVAPIAGLGA